MVILLLINPSCVVKDLTSFSLYRVIPSSSHANHKKPFSSSVIEIILSPANPSSEYSMLKLLPSNLAAPASVPIHKNPRLSLNNVLIVLFGNPSLMV